MNRDRAKELLPIIEAFANGEGVEFKPRQCGDKPWKSLDDFWNLTESTDDYNMEYRIKPKAREFWLCASWPNPKTSDYAVYPIKNAFGDDEILYDHYDSYIKVREVL